MQSDVNCFLAIFGSNAVHFCVQDWMAFETLHRPLFSEHGSVNFPNDYTPLESDNFAFCKVYKNWCPKLVSNCLYMRSFYCSFVHVLVFVFVIICFLSQSVQLTRNYTRNPLVMATATHQTGSGRKNPQYNGISSWIEVTPLDNIDK